MFLDSVLNGIGTGLGFLFVLSIAGVIAWRAGRALIRRTMQSIGEQIASRLAPMGGIDGLMEVAKSFSSMIPPTGGGPNGEEPTASFGASDNPR